MKWMAFFALAVATSLGAQETTVFDFEKDPAEAAPEGAMVVDGDWVVTDVEGKKALALRPVPMTDGAALLGASLPGQGVIKAKVFAPKNRRAFPRFGLSLFGISGVKLKFIPAEDVILLTRGANEDPTELAKGKHLWKPDGWQWLELSVRPAGAEWAVEGRVWADGTERPVSATLTAKLPAAPGTGKAGMFALPFANKPVAFDDVSITP